MSNQVQVQVNQTGPSASEGLIRNHRIRMDRPQSKGGENRGPMGGEVLLAGLGGCFMSNLLAAADSRNIGISNVRLVISGTLENTPPHFSSIEVRITAAYSDREQAQKLVTIAERGCITANTLKNAVELRIRIAD